MAGFLDPKTRVMDVVLTGFGRKLLSQKQLRFCYWAAFDDEVDYDPYISESGSLNEQDLNYKKMELIESTFVREPISGYSKNNFDADDQTNVQRPIFSKQQNKDDLPRTLFPQLTGSFLVVKQRSVVQVVNATDKRGQIAGTPQQTVAGVERLDAENITVEISLSKDGFSQDFVSDGILVRFFKSGSSGLEEVSARRDLENDLSVDRDLKVFTGVKK